MTEQENFWNQFALLTRNNLKQGYILSQLDLANIRLIGRYIFELMDKDNRPEADKEPAEFIVLAIKELQKDGTLKQEDPYKIFVDAWFLNHDLSVKA